MRTINHTVRDENGIHARPAGIVVSAAKKHEASATIKYGDKSGDCKRIFSVMGLGIKSGDDFLIEIEGADEDAAAEDIAKALSDSGI